MRHSDTSWDERQKRLAEAKTLADFANLEPSDVGAFRKDHPDFFPAAWWDYRPTTLTKRPTLEKPTPKMQWEIVQQMVRDTWLRQFRLPPFWSTWLLTSVFDPEEMGWDEEHRPPFVTGLHVLDIDSYPYHEAVQWLVGQSWRVKQCEQCGKCFIAEASQRRFCSNDGDTSCFWAHRKAGRKNNADEVNKDRRNNYDPKARRRRYLRDKRRKA